MRVIDLYLPSEQADALGDILDIADAIVTRARCDEQICHIRIVSAVGSPDEFLEKLKERVSFEDRNGKASMVISEPLSVSPRDEEASEKHARQAAFDEIEGLAESGGVIDRWFLVMAATAAVLAAGGILLGSVPVVVGAMVIAPVFKPLLAIAFGSYTGRARVAFRGVGTTGIAVGLATVAGAVFAALTPGLSPNSLMQSRAELNLFNTIVAIAAGAAGGYTVIRNDRSALIGIVIAASLVPAAAALGVGLGARMWMLAGNSLLTLATNIVAIVVAIVLVLRIEGFRSPLRDEEAQGNKVASRAAWIGAGAMLLLATPTIAGFVAHIGEDRLAKAVERAAAEHDPHERLVLAHRVNPETRTARVYVIEPPDERTRDRIERAARRAVDGAQVEWLVVSSELTGAGGPIRR